MEKLSILNEKFHVMNWGQRATIRDKENQQICVIGSDYNYGLPTLRNTSIANLFSAAPEMLEFVVGRLDRLSNTVKETGLEYQSLLIVYQKATGIDYVKDVDPRNHKFNIEDKLVSRLGVECMVHHINYVNKEYIFYNTFTHSARTKRAWPFTFVDEYFDLCV